MKMYILVKKSVESHKVVGVAHGVLMCHLRYHENEDYKRWLDKSFKKVICEVSDQEFDMCKIVDKGIVVTESSLGNQEIALAFCPRPDDQWPKSFKFFKLLK